jgi:GntR family transcriptional repressor for pyruvate dehydrogenase complex
MMRENAHTVVLNYVKDRIISGEYRTGDKLPPERELAEMLGVSRNAVREGIKELSVLGLIDSTQGSGNYVTNDFLSVNAELLRIMYATDMVSYSNMTEYRYGLELLAFSLAINGITENQRLELEEIIRQIDSTTDDARIVALDKRLHMLLAEASGNKLLLNNYYALSAVMDVYMFDTRSRFVATPSGFETVQREHRRLVQAIRERDIEKGRDAIDKHYKALAELENK